MLSIAVIFFLLAIPAGAEEFPVIETGYTYVDGDTCDVFSYPAVDKFSHTGLSGGKVAYSKDKDPLIYIWDSGTGETKTFDTTEVAVKKDDWISFWMEIKCLDISEGVVYYSLSTHRATHTGTSASTEGLFSFDGENNEKIFDHLVDNLRGDEGLVFIEDASWFDQEDFTNLNRLRIYSHETGEMITIDDCGDINDLIGFGDGNAAVAITTLSSKSGIRIPEDGVTVFRLSPDFNEGSVETVTIPSSTGYSYREGSMIVSRDCFSGDILIWSKEVSANPNGSGEDGWNILYATDLNTLEDTVIDRIEEPIEEIIEPGDIFDSFGFYSYAVDGDYLIYRKDDRIFLYHIPDGEKKEIRITGNDEFEVGDIIEFDAGQLLVRAYPKEYSGYEPSKYEIWFVDLNPYINPTGTSETGTTLPATSASETRETPVLLVVPGLAVLIVFVLFAFSLWRKR
jgi:hypothetical protein